MINKYSLYGLSLFTLLFIMETFVYSSTFSHDANTSNRFNGVFATFDLVKNSEILTKLSLVGTNVNSSFQTEISNFWSFLDKHFVTILIFFCLLMLFAFGDKIYVKMIIRDHFVAILFFIGILIALISYLLTKDEIILWFGGVVLLIVGLGYVFIKTS